MFNNKREFDKGKCWYKDVCTLYDTEYCSKSCVRYIKMDYLTHSALLTEKQSYSVKLVPDECDYEAFKRLQDIQKNVERFVSSGKQVLICSAITGNGKTAWAIKILLNYFDKIWHKCDLECKGLIVNVPTFFNLLKDNISENIEKARYIKENIIKADLVIWDEIGVKSLTNYENDILLSYIDQRISNGKSNIYTSNLNSEQLKEVLGVRLQSRIVNNCEVIELFGDDKRGVQW